MTTFLWFLRTRSFETYKPLLGFSLASLAFATATAIAFFGLKSHGLAATLCAAGALCTWWTAVECWHLWLDYQEEKDSSS